MKDHKYKEYICWGVTAILVIAVSIMLVFLLLNAARVKAWFTLIFGILTPITYGAVLAYLVTPIYNFCVRKSRVVLEKGIKSQRLREHLARTFGTAVSFVFICAVVIGLIWMLLPQLVNSVIGIIETLPGNIENLALWLQKILADNPQMEGPVLSTYDKVMDMVQNWLTTDLMPNLDKVITGVSSGVISVLVLFKNMLIGLIVMVYLLNIKERFAAQGKKIIYAVLPLRASNRVIREIRFIHKVFGGFIIGKLLDSLIIGILCFFCLKIMNMPYVLLISVIIGVTNIIPFFGPFIGAVPSAVLILLASPVKCLYFLIFIFLLQQFDGNILGPKILGDSTGLSSFWVLFSILLFGGLFGFVGMIIGVPTFAVIYDLFSEWITRSLTKKKLSANTADYQDLDYVDEDK